MIELLVMTVVLTAGALYAQAKHYSYKLELIRSQGSSTLDKELKELKANVSSLNMRSGFGK